MLTGSKIADSTIDVAVVVRDLRRRATHDAGDAERAVRVGDQERLRVQVAVHVVQRREALPCPRAAGR